MGIKSYKFIYTCAKKNKYMVLIIMIKIVLI